MRNGKWLLLAMLISAPLPLGCARTELVVLAQAPWSLASETPDHVVLAPLDVSDVGDPAMPEMAHLLDLKLQQTLGVELGIQPMSAGGPSPSDRLVLYPRVTFFAPESREEVLRVRVRITTPEREIIDEIALRAVPGSCLRCPAPGEPGAPSTDTRARREIEAIATKLAGYVSMRLQGGDHRHPGKKRISPSP